MSVAVELPRLRSGCIVPRVSATKVAPHHPNPGNAAARWMRRAAHHPPPPDRTGGRAGSSTPRACQRYRAPPHGSSVARPPGQDRHWAAINGPTSSRAAEVASTPPARGWPASPAPYTPTAWRGRVSVTRSASFTAPIACPANRCASPPGTVMALGAAVRDGISWQGNRRIQAVTRTQASWQRRQFTGPSLNRLGSCNAACGRYRRRHAERVARERRRTPLRRAVARLPGRHEPSNVM